MTIHEAAERLRVGQNLWWVWRNGRRGEPCEVTVVKVGRKWAELSNRYRIDLIGMWADGGKYMSPGACYLSREHYERAVALSRKWLRFQNAVRRRSSEGTTIDAIEAAASALGIELKEAGE